QPLSEVSLPAMSRLQEDHNRMRQAIYRGMGLNAVVMFAVFIGLAAVASDLVPLLFGAKWAAASGLCALLSVYALISALQIFSFPALLAAGLTGKYTALSAYYATGVLIASLIGVQFGVTYIVGGLIINSLIQVIPCLMLLHERIGLSPLHYFKP